MRIAFAGTPEFAVPTLDALLASRHQVVGVWCQPDRPAGRGRQLRQCPVKIRALANAVRVLQPPTMRSAEAQRELTLLNVDVMVVAAYGLILPTSVLDRPRLGCINVHASLLPRWRGAAPIQRAILAGDKHTGISIMQMEAGLDTGPVYATSKLMIHRNETAGNLHDRLAAVGAKTLLEVVDQLAVQTLTPVPQPEIGACYASKLSKKEAWLDWNEPAVRLERQVLAFNPWPVACARWSNQTIRIWRAKRSAKAGGEAPGRVLWEDRDGIAVATGDGVLLLTEIQLPGKRPLTAEAFLNAHSLSGNDLA